MIALALHGGAGALKPEAYSIAQMNDFEQALHAALDIGYTLLVDGASAVDAVEAAVCYLEDFPGFNAGQGAVFSTHGKIELNASIMDGSNLQAGGIACVTQVRNPITGARMVMDQSPHIVLSGTAAEDFLVAQGMELCEEKYFATPLRWEQLQRVRKRGGAALDHESDQESGTVGAVARDRRGNLAAATSTGGMTNQTAGRISDSSLPGAGTFANNQTCAISGTGYGDFFIRTALCHEVSAQMQLGGHNLQTAARNGLEKLASIGGKGGLIAVDFNGAVVMSFNTTGMFRAYRNERGEQEIGVFRQ